MIGSEKLGGKINAPPSFLQRDVSDIRIVNFGGSTRCVFAPCLFSFFDADEIYNPGCKAYAIMCECDALAFRTISAPVYA